MPDADGNPDVSPMVQDIRDLIAAAREEAGDDPVAKAAITGALTLLLAESIGDMTPATFDHLDMIIIRIGRQVRDIATKRFYQRAIAPQEEAIQA
jgi:hypothetical protein